MGSTIASDNTIDVEINNRIQAASGAFGGLEARMVTTWYFSLHKVQGVQGNCAPNTTVLSRHTLSIVAILENSPKCISDIYDKSCRSHGKIKFQMLKS